MALRKELEHKEQVYRDEIQLIMHENQRTLEQIEHKHQQQNAEKQ